MYNELLKSNFQIIEIKIKEKKVKCCYKQRDNMITLLKKKEIIGKTT